MLINNPYDEQHRDRDNKDFKELITANDKNYRIMDEIANKNPKLAKHFLHRNDLIEKFAKHLGGGVEILNQPMCSCERIAAWDIGHRAYCFHCNKHTNNPIKVKDYLLEYTKNMSEEDLEMLNNIERDDEDEGIIIR